MADHLSLTDDVFANLGLDLGCHIVELRRRYL
jgi:hypothetical protein